MVTVALTLVLWFVVSVAAAFPAAFAMSRLKVKARPRAKPSGFDPSPPSGAGSLQA